MRKETVNAAFFFLVLTALLVLAFFIVLPLLDFIVLGFLLAIGFWPLHRRVLAALKHRGWSAFVSILVVAILVIAPLALVAVTLLDDLHVFIAHFDPSDVEGSLIEAFGLEPGSRSAELAEFVLPHVMEFLSGLTQDLAEVIARALIGLMVLVFVLFYAFAEGPKMVEQLKDIMPLKNIYREKLVRETGAAVHAIFFGQIFVSVVHGIVMGAGYYLFGVPQPVLWGFVTIIISILPAIGTPTVYLPLAAYLYLTGSPTDAILLAVWGIVLSTGFIEHWWKLKLIGRLASIHPLLVLLGVIGGIGIFGLSGFIFGPLILALLVVFTRVFSNTYKEDENYVFL